MSADNWAVCPHCFKEAQEKYDQLVAEFDAAYGKVPLAEYKQMEYDVAQGSPDEETYHTFREDYEFYHSSPGVLAVSYSGHCTECNCGLDIEEEHNFDV